MASRIATRSMFLLALAAFTVTIAPAQKIGTRMITAEELRIHLGFVASDETEGRSTPSAGGSVVARYLATMAAKEGLKPIMADGSFFQDVPLNALKSSELRSRMTVKSAAGESVLYAPRDFGGNMGRPGSVSAETVFVGCGLMSQESNWNDFDGIDLKGKVVVALECQLPAGHPMAGANHAVMRQTIPAAAEAAAVLTVISPERERDLHVRGVALTPNVTYRLREKYATDINALPNESSVESRLPMRAEVRHAAAARILGISENELIGMFTTISEGRQVAGKVLGTRVELSVETDTGEDKIRNVLAVAEGTDDTLKNEYVLIGAHYDHLGLRNGRPLNGADDNGSGTVALLEIARALIAERPKRSVILAWFAGEERGLWGSHHFVNHPPVPIEMISATINLDMISRNDPNSIYLVAVNNLSTELEPILQTLGERQFNISFDLAYNSKSRSSFYYRSDHYPFLRMGIPSVWMFGGTTSDYHQPGDRIERVDFTKIEKIARLAYASALEIGNRPHLLKLDVNPNVTSRGRQNIDVESVR